LVTIGCKFIARHTFTSTRIGIAGSIRRTCYVIAKVYQIALGAIIAGKTIAHYNTQRIAAGAIDAATIIVVAGVRRFAISTAKSWQADTVGLARIEAIYFASTPVFTFEYLAGVIIFIGAVLAVITGVTIAFGRTIGSYDTIAIITLEALARAGTLAGTHSAQQQ